MATVRNMAELEKALNNTIYMAIKKAQQSAYDVIQDFIKDYYHDYTPIQYERTHQFFNSLMKSEIKKISGGWECEVYIDLDSLDYYRHEAYDVIDMINRGFHADKSMNGGVRLPYGETSNPYKALYDIKVGTQVGGTGRFWDDSIDLFKRTALIVKIFEEYFKKRGFKVTVR